MNRVAEPESMTFDLTGKLLISTPAMGDPRFAHSVIYLCAHSGDGAFGLIINRSVRDLQLADVLDQLGISASGNVPAAPVLLGGPVEAARGFVLYRSNCPEEPEGPDDPSRQPLADGLELTVSPKILAEIARGEGPSDWLLALGYSGWGPGQLETEIARNAWLTCDATNALIFDPERGEALWRKALHSMGVNPRSLSAVAGNA